MQTVTLDNLICNNHGLRVFCDSCVRWVNLDVTDLLDRYDKSMSLPFPKIVSQEPL